MSNQPQLRCLDCKRPMVRDASGGLDMSDHADDCTGMKKKVVTAEQVPA